MRIDALRWVLSGAMLLGLVGCAAPPVIVDGYKMSASAWERDAAILRARAAYDLACPRPDVTLTLITGNNYAKPCRDPVGVATTVGAKGCGQQATYMRLDMYDPWIMNNASRHASAGSSAARAN